MTKTAAQALLEYGSLAREIPGLKNAHGPIRHPPAGEVFTAGFVAGWDFRGQGHATDLAEARDNFAAMTGEASRLEAAMEVLEVESALRIAHLEERVLELQLYRSSRRQAQIDERIYVREIGRVLGERQGEGALAAARRVVAREAELLSDRLGVVVEAIRFPDAPGLPPPTPSTGSTDAAIGNRIADSMIAFSGSGLRVYTRDRRARELTIAEVENRDPVAHCTMCPECGAPLGNHTPVVLYRVRPEDPLWEVRLRCPPAVPRRTVRDVLGASDAETDAWAAERVVREREEARRSADNTTAQLVEWRRAAAEMLGRDPDGTLDDDATMRTLLRARLDEAAAKSALITSGVATALTRQGVTLPEQPALGDLVAGVRTLGERAQRTIPGKPAARGAGSATAAEAQFATLFADLIDALGLDPDMTHATAEIAAQARERIERIGRLTSETERHRRALASALNQDPACSMDSLLEAALGMRRMGAAPEIRAMRDRLAAELGTLRRSLGAILDPAGEADHTTGSLTELARARVSALENARGVIDAISKRVSERDGGSVVEAVHNLSLLAQKRGEALAEALDAWAGWAGRNITDEQRARISELRSLQVRPAAVGEAG